MVPWFETEDPIPTPRPCILCDALLESVEDSWDRYQPHKGMEIQLHPAFGSSLDCMGEGIFRGVICDDCGQKLVKKMDLHPS